MLALGVSTNAGAGQPIFSEMPRWSDGWGIQVIPEYRRTSIEGPTTDNVRHHSAALLNIDGVYTWRRWIRATLKVPIVVNPSSLSKGLPRHMDAATLAVPFKKYFNLDGRTGSWTFAPQIKTPSKPLYGSEHGFKHGWNLSYDTETYRFHYGVLATVWGSFDKVSAEADVEAFVGMNVHGFDSSGHIKLHTTVFAKRALRLTGFRAGPTFYWRLSDTWHMQAQWRYLHHDNPNGETLSETRTRLGFAVVF